ncbi:MAG TPA: hypothetical protein VGQ42_06065 [Candidatus Dormibacteraeota bacterium]|nr:hypothetical protein [Candidatus Dormibacteraeota bacterium]
MDVRPLGGALALVLLIAGGSWVAAVTKHHNTGSSAQTATPTPWPIITAEPETPAPTPVPTVPPSPPPQGVELLWRTVPDQGDRLEAIDWSGQVRGGLLLPADRNKLGSVVPSVDGQRLLVSVSGTDTVMSAQGRTLFSLTSESNRDFRTWSDDGNHLCDVRSTGDTSAQVFLVPLGSQPRLLTSLRWPQGDGRLQVLVCSVKQDVAVVSIDLGDDMAGHVWDIKVVRLSTGATIRDVHPPEFADHGGNLTPLPGTLSQVSASPDGRLLALTAWTEPDSHSAPTDIVDTLSGRKLGHVNGWVRSFSGDGAEVLIETQVLNWRTGKTVHAPAGCCGSIGPARPGSAGIVVGIASGPVPTPGTASSPAQSPPPDDMVLLRPDGSTLHLTCCGQTIL